LPLRRRMAMAKSTVAIEGTTRGKGASADLQKKVHDALTKTIQAELAGEIILPTHHGSFHVSITDGFPNGPTKE
jgi:hypothetical protein